MKHVRTRDFTVIKILKVKMRGAQNFFLPKYFWKKHFLPKKPFLKKWHDDVIMTLYPPSPLVIKSKHLAYPPLPFCDYVIYEWSLNPFWSKVLIRLVIYSPSFIYSWLIVLLFLLHSCPKPEFNLFWTKNKYTFKTKLIFSLFFSVDATKCRF